MTQLFFSNTDALGPRKKQIVLDCFEWLNDQHYTGKRQLDVEFVPKTSIRFTTHVALNSTAPLVPVQHIAWGIMDYNRSPWLIRLATQHSSRKIVTTACHEWRHAMQKSNRAGFRFASKSLEYLEQEADEWGSEMATQFLSLRKYQ